VTFRDLIHYRDLMLASVGIAPERLVGRTTLEERISNRVARRRDE